MSGPVRSQQSWTATLAWALLLLLVGAGLAVWGLGRWQPAAQFLGVAPPPPTASIVRPPTIAVPADPAPPDPAQAAQVAALDQRLRAVENATRQVAGSAGRADALLIAFASRRAIDRGVPLGYLESLLSERFGAGNPRAVAAIITFSRDPVTLDQLRDGYARLEPELGKGPPGESLWAGFRRELGTLVAVRRAHTPSAKPEARFGRALENLQQGEVDAALAETMRLPGAARAAPWIGQARRYILAHRALDEVESAALLGGGR